jgi:hypothetical protein
VDGAIPDPSLQTTRALYAWVVGGGDKQPADLPSACDQP